MAILVLSAKERLVHFDDAHKLAEVGVFHRGAQPMAHIPSRLVRPASDLALNLKRAYALLGIEHLPEHFKPRLQRILGVLEDRSADDTEAVVFAKLAEPMERSRVEFIDGGVAAFRASDRAVMPAVFHQELLARVIGREGSHQLSERHHDPNLTHLRLRVNRVIIALVSWIEYATRPNPKDAESARRHYLLQEFQQEFAEFIGAKSVSLYVQGYSLPLPYNEQREIAVTVDGRVRLLSQLGAGIGESLIVLFVSKLS